MHIIIFTIIFFIFLYICFVYFYRRKMDNIEFFLQKKINSRNNKIISLFYISKPFLNKHSEVFKEYINLLEKDFLQNSKNFYFENKNSIYKKIQNEINFIFKICETNEKLKINEKYNYIKDEILKESKIIWKEYNIYSKNLKNYQIYHNFSKFFLIWFFLR